MSIKLPVHLKMVDSRHMLELSGGSWRITRLEPGGEYEQRHRSQPRFRKQSVPQRQFTPLLL